MIFSGVARVMMSLAVRKATGTGSASPSSSSVAA
jgi:hypothetical protein